MKGQSNEVQLQLSELSSGSVLFKIFGHEKFTFKKAYRLNKVDWSGFYTQLNPEHSMRYLTKKWDDGADEACLVLLRPIQNLKLIKVIDKQFFSNPKISGEQKANRIKQSLRKKALQQHKDFQNFNLKIEELLLKSLGQRQTLLECIDMEQNEIIIPHSMLNEKYFQFKSLLVFKKSNDGLLRTIGWKWGDEITQNSDWNYIKGECQYEPYLILEEQEKIKTFIQKLKHFSETQFLFKKQNS